MDTIRIRKVIGAIRDMPTLPTSVDRVRRMLADPKANTSSLAALISSDPCLAVRILRVGNSAYYVPQKTCDIQKAVTQLGFETVAQAFRAVSPCKTFDDDANGLWDRTEFWRHSIAVGVIARMLATHSGQAPPAEAYTCGLLHDIGKHVMDQYFHAEMLTALRDAAGRRKTFAAAEKATIPLDHTAVGEAAARNWHLPPTLVSAIRYHHSEPADRKGVGGSDEVLVDVVRLADYLAREIGVGSAGDGCPPEWTPALAERFRFPDGTLERVRQQAPAEIDRCADLIQLPKRADSASSL